MEEQFRHHLFDRYLRGELDQRELDEFNKSLQDDPDFAAAFEMHRYLVEGIRQAKKEELKAYLKEHSRPKVIRSVWTGIWPYASAAVLLMFGVMYVVLERRQDKPDLAMDSPEQTISPKEKDSIGPVKTPEKTPRKEEKTPQTRDPQSVGVVEEERILEEVVEDSAWETEINYDERPDYPMIMEPPNSKAAQDNGENDLPVKSDTRLYDTLISLNVVYTGQEGENVQKTDISIQYWKSVINYKGYRFDGRRLELFGINPEDSVSLHYLVLDPKLKVFRVYLKWGDLYYALTDDNTYHPYKPEKDQTILEKLK